MSALDEGGSRLTRTGMIFGTPEYMSPEQAKGDKPDHRVDIYAAGCILYEMLTGDVPFHAETFMGVLTKHMFEDPQPPSQRNPGAGIPGDVEAVCMKALAKDRDQRFQTMKEMALALEACTGGDVAQAWGNEPSGVGGGLREASQAFRTPGTMSRATVGSPGAAVAPPKKRGGLVIGGLVALLVAGGAAVVVLSQKKPVELPKPAPIETPKPIAKVEQPKPVVPPKPTQFTMAINTQPAGAEVFNGNERLGVTPCNVVLAASEKPVELMLKKKGWRDQPLKIVPDRDHDFVADLMPASKPSHGPSAKGPKSTAPTAKPEAPTAKPEAPTAKPESPKPAGKLRDLKDPFAN
jgi:serine/threonine-protein kinase